MKPTTANMRHFRSALYRAVSSASAKPQQAVVWVMEVEKVDNIAVLQDHGGEFEKMDRVIPTALTKLIDGELSRKVQCLDDPNLRMHPCLTGDG